MNKLWTSLFLVAFFSVAGWGQGVTGQKSLGLMVNFRGEQTVQYFMNSGDQLTNKSSFLQVSPLAVHQRFKRWEFGVRSAVIWNRVVAARVRDDSITINKKDLFILSASLTTRFYFSYPENKMRTFLHGEHQILFGVGDKEINSFGTLMTFGIGCMYHINENLAVESMVTTPMLSYSNKVKGLPFGLQLWLGFRHYFNKKVTQ